MHRRMKIKVCGMNNLDNLLALESLGLDYFGFICYSKSPRHFDLFSMPSFQNTKKVGVFVNEEVGEVVELQSQFQLDAVQLHGDEDVDYITRLKSKLPNGVDIFKAISIIEKEDISKVTLFENVVDLIILDTKTKLRGGSGEKFDWRLLDYYDYETPFLLSGGIQEDDVKQVSALYEKYDKMLGVDINSKFEVEPGLKDEIKVKRFIKNIKNYAVRG